MTNEVRTEIKRVVADPTAFARGEITESEFEQAKRILGYDK